MGRAENLSCSATGKNDKKFWLSQEEPDVEDVDICIYVYIYVCVCVCVCVCAE